MVPGSHVERLLAVMPDAVLVVAEHGPVRYVNEAALDLFGRTREDLLGEHLGFSVKDGEPAEISIMRRGEPRLCEMRVVPVEWSGERAYVASIRDRTERIRAEETRARAAALESENKRVLESNRLKSELLANLSHELRTPLNAIIGFTQILIDRHVTPDAPEYEEFLGDILASATHLLHLINDLLDMAKIEAGKMELRPETVRFPAVCAEVTAMVRPAAEHGRLLLDVDIEPSIDTVSLDPVRLKQILYNYLSNAIKFTLAGGKVTLRARRDGPWHIRIEVEDTGIGIAPEQISQLFSDFHQVDAARSHRGSGLGLAITRRLVEMQGGSVGVESAPGKGSVFHAVLPLCAP